MLTRPMALADLLDGAWAVITRSPASVLGAAAAVVVPLHVLMVFLQRDAYTDLSGSLFGSNALFSGADPLTLLAVALLSMLIPLYLGAVLTTFITGWYAGQEVSAGTALLAALRRSGGILVVWLVFSPLCVAVFVRNLHPLLAVVASPALVLVTFFLVTVPMMLAERAGPFASMGRSARLMTKRFGWGLLLVGTSGLMAVVLKLLLPALPSLVAAALPDPFRWMTLALATAAVSVLVDTAVIAATVLFYVDLRIRLEGLDLELRMPDAFGPQP